MKTTRRSTGLELLALVLVDPDEQLGILVGTDVVRDAVSAVLGQSLLLGDHLQARVTHGHLHVQTRRRT